MADYHKMYLHLFNEVTRAINILQDAQAAAEEMFIGASEAPISLADTASNDEASLTDNEENSSEHTEEESQPYTYD